mmetsp:Transcript_27562/g.49656  ORF Transcript_27562/g.49656 Transcript_27562/m.49656 type:complete len:104 (-) Transcript_27562:181-492(-)
MCVPLKYPPGKEGSQQCDQPQVPTCVHRPSRSKGHKVPETSSSSDPPRDAPHHQRPGKAGTQPLARARGLLEASHDITSELPSPSPSPGLPPSPSCRLTPNLA